MSKKRTRGNDFYSFYSQREHPFPKIHRSRFPGFLVASFLIFLAVSAWFGYVLFSNKQEGVREPIEVTLQAPSSGARGVPIEYTLAYKNTSNAAVPSVQIFVEYPAHFTILNTEPPSLNEKKNFWNIGSVQAGSGGLLKIRGIFGNDTERQSSLTASLQYEDPIYDSSFVIKRSTEITFDTQDQGRLHLEGPQSLREGDNASYTIIYQDPSDIGAIDTLDLEVEIPAWFMLSDQLGAARAGQILTWPLSTPPGQFDALTGKRTMTLKGAVEKSTSGPAQVVARIILREGSDSRKTLVESSTTTEIFGGDLALDLRIRDQQEPKPIQFGSKIPVAITYTNNGNVTLRDVTISVTIKGMLAMISQTQVDNAKTEGDHITWDARTLKALERVRPGEKGILVFSMPVQDTSVLETMQFAPADQSIIFQVRARSEKQEMADGALSDTPNEYTGPTVVVPLFSDAKMTAFAKNAPPSQVRVYWSLENSLHELSEIIMTGVVAKGLSWSGDQSRTAGEISYNAKTRMVTWKLNKLPSTVKRIDASFVLNAPQGSVANVPLMTDIRFSAVDSLVSDTITQNITELTAP